MAESLSDASLLVTDHYDAQIRALDLYTDKLLKSYKSTDLVGQLKPRNLDVDETTAKRDNDVYDDSFMVSFRNSKMETYGVEAYNEPYTSQYKYPSQPSGPDKSTKVEIGLN